MEEYSHKIDSLTTTIRSQLEEAEDKTIVLRASEWQELFNLIKTAPNEIRPQVGQRVNQFRREIEQAIQDHSSTQATAAIDVSAPFDVNASVRPTLFPETQGSLHPLISELERAFEIFERMGFQTVKPRQLDDDYHMFTSLNFPTGHPARDNWDSFVTDEGLLPIAHTTAMDNRFLKEGKPPIAVVTAGRCFRNEDVDTTHDHSFYQLDGIYVAENASLADMIGVLKTFFEAFFERSLKVKTQPAHFPFTEPSLEFLIEKPDIIQRSGDWLEVLGCGMVHPNVIREGGLDPEKYKGFAFGGGLDRLVMLKYGIEDVRHLGAGNLAFLRKFSS